MDLKIKKLYEDAKIPSYGSEEAAGLDLYTYLDERLRECGIWLQTESVYHNKSVYVINTGLSLELPKGTVGIIRPRSSAFRKGLMISGVLDSDFRGQVMVQVWNISNQDISLHHGDRIAQLIVMPYIKVNIEEVLELSNTIRGENGFGSTGQ
ncbi:MAG: dUTP diphosphatase [Elusimicrobia bacterium]|nr:dUTP diphosphatase [Elusimicrobiota bacterium]